MRGAYQEAGPARSTGPRRPSLRRHVALGLALGVWTCWSCLPVHAAAPPCTVSAEDLAAFEPTIRAQIVAARDRADRDTSADTVGRLGQLLHAYDRFRAAVDCYAQARALAPGSHAWPYYQGVALAQAGDLTGAAGAFEAASTLAPADTAVRLRLADAWFDLGRVTESERLARDIVRDHPGTTMAYYHLGRALAARGDAGALDAFDRALALAPDFGAAHYARALVLRQRGQQALAEEALARFQATRNQPAPLEDPLMAAVVALRAGPHEDLARGRALQERGRYAEAIPLLEAAVQAQPELVQAHVNLIAAYGALGQHARAEAAYRAAIALAPGLAEAYYNAGVLFLSQHRDEDAAAAFTRALVSNPSHAGAHNNLGFLKSRAGEPAEAEAHFRAAIAASPGHRDAHFNLARLLLASGRSDEALAEFAQAAATEDDRTALYLYYLADACARTGKFDDAERHAIAARSRAERSAQADLVRRIDDDLRRLRERKARP